MKENIVMMYRYFKMYFILYLVRTFIFLHQKLKQFLFQYKNYKRGTMIIKSLCFINFTLNLGLFYSCILLVIL